jgi:ribose transport system ATP-binding protein
LQEIFEVADNVTVLRDGHYIDTLEVQGTTRRQLISLMVGRDLGETFPEGGYAKDACVLQVVDLCGERFRNISFKLNRGEILGIAGLVGAGRSEVGRAIFGADPISSGGVFLDGKKVHIGSPREAIRHGIGLIPEDRKQQGLLLKLSVLHNVSLSCLKSVKRRGLLSAREERSMVGRFVKDLGVKTPHLDQLVNYLSGGNQQKTVLAKWLATRSKILIVDEPTRGIDVGAKQEIYQLMRQLTREGISIITISSEMPELIGISDRILVMCKGEIRGELGKENFTQDRILELAAGYTA